MAARNKQLVFDTNFDPQTGTPVQVAPNIVRVTAPNAGVFTFTGTNSYVLGESELAIVDPGPNDDSHLAALQKVVAGRRVAAILLTHTHKDHSSLAPRLSQLVGAPVCARGPHVLSRKKRIFELNPVAGSCDWALRPDIILGDRQVLSYVDFTTEVLDTSGHCSNHASFAFTDGTGIVTGDHIMGWSSTLVSVPDGSMADYFRSLDRIIEFGERTYFPGHGNIIADGLGYALALKAHRELRNDQILDAVAKGAGTIGALLPTIYPNLEGKLKLAARMTLKAQLEYLGASGRLHFGLGRVWP